MPRDYAGLADYGNITANEENVNGGLLPDLRANYEGWDKKPSTRNGEWITLDAAPRKARNRSKEIEQENAAIELEITSSKYILRIAREEDDDEFVAYEAETLERAITFLRRLALHAHSCGVCGIGVPDIVPAAKGSIDLLWRSPAKRLLMNFPADQNERVSFFGRKGESELAGRFDSNDARPELLFWLAS